MGNVGSISAALLHKEGFRVIAVSDVSGGICCSEGLNIPEIRQYLSVKGNLLKDYNAEGVKHISNAELLSTECDILVPAALENQINGGNADAIRAKIIVEGANGPTTAEADAILEAKGITVVPDILANAGGVVVSYFEWVQNIESFHWTVEDVNNRLEKIMNDAFDNVWEKATEKGQSMRTGAYLVALSRVVEAQKLRGIWP